MRTAMSGSGFLVRMRIVSGFTTCTASMVVKPGVTTVLPDCMLRSSVALTSSAVNGRAVVELDAGAQRELPGRLVDRLPGGRESRLELERRVPARQRVVEVDEVVDRQDLGRASRVHGGRLGGLGDDDLAGLGRARRGGCQQEDRPRHGARQAARINRQCTAADGRLATSRAVHQGLLEAPCPEAPRSSILRRNHSSGRARSVQPHRSQTEAPMSNAPVASYSLIFRIRIVNTPGMLGKVTSAIGAEGGDIGAIDIVDVGQRGHPRHQLQGQRRGPRPADHRQDPRRSRASPSSTSPTAPSSCTWAARSRSTGAWP